MTVPAGPCSSANISIEPAQVAAAQPAALVKLLAGWAALG